MCICKNECIILKKIKIKFLLVLYAIVSAKVREMFVKNLGELRHCGSLVGFDYFYSDDVVSNIVPMFKPETSTKHSTQTAVYIYVQAMYHICVKRYNSELAERSSELRTLQELDK